MSAYEDMLVARYALSEVKRLQAPHKKRLADKLAERRKRLRVYFIQDGQRIKIGISEFPESRLQTFRTTLPRAELIGSIPGSYPLETKLHKQFCDVSCGGEWFWATAEVVDAVHSLVAFGGAQ